MTYSEFDIDHFEQNSELEYVEAGDPVNPDESINFITQFITGPAGTGKTYTIKQLIADDPSYGILTATTGIAAINLNTITLNSALKYFDTDSLWDNYVTGRLTRSIKELSRTYNNIIIDEVSMMSGKQLDILFMAVRDHNRHSDKPFGIILTGDFLQLPPVKETWAFEAECWPYFEKNTTVLTKIWRQSDPKFLDAINLIRAGKGKEGAELLKEAGVVFAPAIDNKFQGTTIMAKNIEVDRFNQLRLMEVTGQKLAMPSYKWGSVSGEAKNIPDELHLKIGALVMVLVNDSPNFSYVNGDLAIVKGNSSTRRGIIVELVRTGAEVTIPYITRPKTSLSAVDSNGKELSVDDVPHYSEWITTDAGTKAPAGVDAPWGQVYYDPERERFVVGAIKYMPLRLAYATSTHKSQGLTLDKVQLDPRSNFFGSPAMAYVALSRARTAEGLRIIGPPALFGARVNIDEKVKRWM